MDTDRPKLQELQTGIHITLSPNDTRQLQDLNTENDSLYLFYNTGEVDCYDMTSRKRLYSAAAYAETEQQYFARTSLVVKAPNSFYQLRTDIKVVCSVSTHANGHGKRYLKKTMHLIL